MTDWVVDASVAVKWLFPEPDQDRAFALLDEANTLHAPDLLSIEVLSAITKKQHRKEISPAIARAAAQATTAFPLQRHATSGLLGSAFELSLETGASVYDSVYLALTLLLDARLITADRKLVTALRPTPWRDRVQWVGER